MFKKTERLSRTDFTKYFKIARRFHSDNFTLLYSPLVSLGVSIVVGKKVYKNAVDRNTLRRRVYAATRTYLKTSPSTQGVFIIIAKPTAKNLFRPEIIPEINTLLAQTAKSR